MIKEAQITNSKTSNNSYSVSFFLNGSRVFVQKYPVSRKSILAATYNSDKAQQFTAEAAKSLQIFLKNKKAMTIAATSAKIN